MAYICSTKGLLAAAKARIMEIVSAHENTGVLVPLSTDALQDQLTAEAVAASKSEDVTIPRGLIEIAVAELQAEGSLQILEA